MLKLCTVKLEAATAWNKKKRCKEKEKEKRIMIEF